MNVYDFDKTIYNGDSSVDFYIYCLIRNPKLLIYLPIQLMAMVLYKLRIKDKKYMKEKFFSFLKGIKNIDKNVNCFWKKKSKKIKDWYLEQHEENDVVISASPEFLLKPICDQLKIKNLIATEVDKKTGIFKSENCGGENKVDRFKKVYKNEKINKFYSDSFSDLPMMKLAKDSYLVKGDSVELITDFEVKNHKSETKVIFFFFLALYFLISFVLMYLYNTGKYCNVLFDMDTRRAFGDMALNASNHYRVSVHPLFVIINQPLVLLLKKIVGLDVIAVAILESIVGAAAVTVFNKILQKLQIKKNIRFVITILFGISYSQLIYSVMPETYMEACLFALLGWYFFIKTDFNKEYNVKDYIWLFILGILGLSAILTNYAQFVLMSFLIIFLNKKEKNKLLKFISLNAVVVMCSVAIAQLQSYIWPSANNYFFSHIDGILYGTDEEFLYMNKTLSFSMFTNVFKPLFLYNFNISKITTIGTQLYFAKSSILDITSLIAFLCFSASTFIHIIKNKLFKKLTNNKGNLFFITMLTVLIFNIMFHFIYGNSTAFLYTANFTFSLFTMIAIMLNKINIKQFLLRIILIVFVFTFLINFIQIMYYIDLENLLIFGSTLSKRAVAILLLVAIMFIVMMLRHRSRECIVCIVILALVTCVLSFFIVTKYQNHSFPEYYELQYKRYRRQMLDLKGSAEIIFITNEQSDYYYFGMANEEKYVYKDGKLIKYGTEDIICEYDVDSELIIPNEYTVLIKTTDGSMVKIFENEKGLYIEDNGNIKEVFIRKNRINLPLFDDYYYSEILRVLLQETLFNFVGSKPTPCVFTYGNTSYYRDAMLMTMVLERSNNIDIIKDWVDGVTDIYDMTRPGLNETDNLGEMLYILYATNSTNVKLKKSIISEIKEIMTPEGTIPSNIDGFVQGYYPTVIAKFALDKFGIDVGLKIPEEDDGYARLTWYTGWRVYSNSYLDGKWYPYLTWGQHHYDNTGYLYMFNKFYPLSYESATDDYSDVINKLEKNEISFPHGWASSEMFLFLFDKGFEYSYNE